MRYCYDNVDENGKRKKILYFCNRKILKEQIERRITNDFSSHKECIDVVMYQGYTAWLKKIEAISYQYGYVIANAFIESIASIENKFDITIPFINDQLPPVNAYGIIEERAIDSLGGETTRFARNQAGSAITCFNGNMYPIFDYYQNPIYPQVSRESIIYEFSYPENSIFTKAKGDSSIRPFWIYDYVVFDEVHYFLQDSLFNFRTYELFELMCKNYNLKQALIFMSGTSKEIYSVINNYLKNIHHISIENDIDLLCPYCFDDKYKYLDAHVLATEAELIEKIKATGDEKWLIFVDSIAYGENLKNKINILCKDESTKPIAKFIYRKPWIDKEVRAIEENCRFDDVRCLIATSIIDNGVSFIDEDLKHVLVIAWDDTEFIQMVGRKRIDTDRMDAKQFDVYIMEKSITEMVAHYKRLVSRLKIIRDFSRVADNRTNPTSHFSPNEKFKVIAKYCNNPNKYSKLNGIVKFTNNGFKVNWLALLKLENSVKLYKELIDIKKKPLSTHQLELLNKHIELTEENRYILRIKKVLNEYLNVEFDKEKLKTLKEELNRCIIKIPDLNCFPIKKINKTNSTKNTNRCIWGLGIHQEIRTIIKKDRNKTRSYMVVNLSEAEHFDRVFPVAKEYMQKEAIQ